MFLTTVLATLLGAHFLEHCLANSLANAAILTQPVAQDCSMSLMGQGGGVQQNTLWQV